MQITLGLGIYFFFSVSLCFNAIIKHVLHFRELGQSSAPGSSLEEQKLEMGIRRNYWRHDLEEEAGSHWHKCKYLILFWASMDQVWRQTGLQGSHPHSTQHEHRAPGRQSVWAVKQCDGHTHGALVPSSLGEHCISCSSFVRPMSAYP